MQPSDRACTWHDRTDQNDGFLANRYPYLTITLRVRRVVLSIVSMVVPYARERRIGEMAVLRASILTKRVQSDMDEISKEDKSPVTMADFAAQAVLIKTVREAFPDDAFLGEEDSSALRDDEPLRDKVHQLMLSVRNETDWHDNKATPHQTMSVEEMLDLIDLGGRGTGSAGRFWVMDPIDGTAAFLKGQQYAVSLALIYDGIEVIGILGCPNIRAEATLVSENDIDKIGLGIMLTAVRGQGSTIRAMTLNGLGGALRLNDLMQSVSNKLHIVDCAADTTHRHDVIAKLAARYHTRFPSTEIWSSHIRYAALIVGGGDVHIWVPAGPRSKMYIWDHAGAQLILTELGGKVTDLDGKDIDFRAGRDLNRNRGMVVARGSVHQSILGAMNTILREEEQVKESVNGNIRPCFTSGVCVLTVNSKLGGLRASPPHQILDRWHYSHSRYIISKPPRRVDIDGFGNIE